MAKTLTATQLKALSALAGGDERQVYECGPTNTVESLHARGLVEWRWNERKLLRLMPGYALVKITDAGRAALCAPVVASPAPPLRPLADETTETRGDGRS